MQGELDEKERENKELKKENQELKNDALQQQQRMQQGWDTEKEQLIAKTAVLEAQGKRFIPGPTIGGGGWGNL